MIELSPVKGLNKSDIDLINYKLDSSPTLNIAKNNIENADDTLLGMAKNKTENRAGESERMIEVEQNIVTKHSVVETKRPTVNLIKIKKHEQNQSRADNTIESNSEEVIDVKTEIETTTRSSKGQETFESSTPHQPRSPRTNLGEPVIRNQANFSNPEEYQPEYKDATYKGDEAGRTKCLNVAKTALIEGNFEKAKRFVTKAERICPSVEGKEVLELIRTKIEVEGTAKDESAENNVQKNKSDIAAETSENLIKRRADNCLVQAKQYLTSGDYETAEKLAKKANNLNPSVEIEKFLEELQLSKELSGNTVPKFCNNVLKLTSSEIKDKSKDDLPKKPVISENGVEILANAMIALEEGELEFAEALFTKVYVNHENVFASFAKQYFHGNLREKRVKSGPKLKRKKFKPYLISDSEAKNFAEIHFNIANYLAARGILTMSWSILQISERFNSNETTKALLAEHEMYLLHKSSETDKHSSLTIIMKDILKRSMNDTIEMTLYQASMQEEAAKYMELYKAALEENDMEKAQQYLLKSVHFNPTEDSLQLVSQLT